MKETSCHTAAMILTAMNSVLIISLWMLSGSLLRPLLATFSKVDSLIKHGSLQMAGIFQVTANQLGRVGKFRTSSTPGQAWELEHHHLSVWEGFFFY